jgi:hypothetical protein
MPTGSRAIMIPKNTIIRLLNYLEIGLSAKARTDNASQTWFSDTVKHLNDEDEGWSLHQFTRGGFDQLLAYEFRFRR